MGTLYNGLIQAILMSTSDLFGIWGSYPVLYIWEKISAILGKNLLNTKNWENKGHFFIGKGSLIRWLNDHIKSLSTHNIAFIKEKKLIDYHQILSRT